MGKIRTRYAPSPTGYLHVGALRTALYNYLFAKQHKGEFLLRIEDTDQARKVEGASESIIATLNAFGLKPDREPVIQSTRREIHERYAQQLVAAGKAYYAFETAEELDQMRKEQEAQKLPPRYDRRALELSSDAVNKKIAQGVPHVIRFMIPDDGEIRFTDLVRGEVSFHTKDLDDFIILKSDGFPTYHLASVVDDHEMGMSHVIRGEEWLPSTPKHILLYRAFGWDIPQFAHLPLLLNPDRSKLSKRQGDVAVEDYLTKGYLKDALINFVALLGWNPGEGSEEEIFTLKELIKRFDLSRVNKAGAVFDIAKLDWMNGLYIRSMQLRELVKRCLPLLREKYPTVSDRFAEKVIAIEQERLKKLTDITDGTAFFFEIPEYDTELLRWKKSDLSGALGTLRAAREFFGSCTESDFSAKKLEKKTMGWISKEGYGVGDVLWPLRVALSGQKNSPSPFEIAGVLGKSEVLNRIEIAISKLS